METLSDMENVSFKNYKLASSNDSDLSSESSMSSESSGSLSSSSHSSLSSFTSTSSSDTSEYSSDTSLTSISSSISSLTSYSTDDDIYNTQGPKTQELKSFEEKLTLGESIKFAEPVARHIEKGMACVNVTPIDLTSACFMFKDTQNTQNDDDITKIEVAMIARPGFTERGMEYNESLKLCWPGTTNGLKESFTVTAPEGLNNNNDRPLYQLIMLIYKFNFNDDAAIGYENGQIVVPLKMKQNVLKYSSVFWPIVYSRAKHHVVGFNPDSLKPYIAAFYTL